MSGTRSRADTAAGVDRAAGASPVASGGVGRAGTRSQWERWNEASLDSVGYVLLVVSTVVALLRPNGSSNGSLLTLGLAAIAGGWIYVLYTRSPQPRRAQRARMRIYVAGLLALAAILTAHNPMFFIFAITGFFHASLVRPWPLTILAVFVTSVLIEVLLTGFPWPTVDLWILFGAVIAIQTVTIGVGSVIGERLTELSEERRQLLAEREVALRENRGLQHQLVAQAREAGVLEERARMAAEIHDTIAQGLTGIVTQLHAAEQAVDRPADRTRHVDNAIRLARESLTEARRFVAGSPPEALETATLVEALRSLAARWSEMHRVAVTFSANGDEVPLHPDIEVALLRTAQEALVNVARHAAATRVGLTLSYMGDVVTLDVRDDGVGFESDARERQPVGADSGFGLNAMRQRLNRLAGTLAIESERGEGTAISARVPAIGPAPAASATTASPT